MKKFVIAALAVTAVVWATTSGAFQPSPQAQLTEDRIVAVIMQQANKPMYQTTEYRSSDQVLTKAEGNVCRERLRAWAKRDQPRA
jgi:hypothetical protein